MGGERVIMVKQTIQKVHTQILEIGESDLGLPAGLTLTAGPIIRNLDAAGVRLGSDNTAVRRSIRRGAVDTTELPDPTWLPSSEASLLSWHDASDATTITNSGDDVSALADKSGNGYTFSEATDTNQPHTGTRTINSLNVLDFNGTTHRLRNTSYPAAANSNLMVLLVANVDAVTNESNSLFRIGNTSRVNLRSVNGAGYFPNAEMFGTGNEAISYGTDLVTITTLYGLVLDFANTTNTLYTNGYSRATDADGYETALDGAEFSLFNNQGSANYFLDGMFAEMIVFNAVDTTVRQKAEGYLAHKWGLESLLDAGHPYKSEAP